MTLSIRMFIPQLIKANNNHSAHSVNILPRLSTNVYYFTQTGSSKAQKSPAEAGFFLFFVFFLLGKQFFGFFFTNNP